MFVSDLNVYTKDEIAIELGCDAKYATSICEMLENSGNAKAPGAPPPPNAPALADNTPPESAPTAKHGKAGQPPGPNEPKEPANKKARPPKPEARVFRKALNPGRGTLSTYSYTKHPKP